MTAERRYLDRGCRCVWMGGKLIAYLPSCKVRRDPVHRPRLPKGAKH